MCSTTTETTVFVMPASSTGWATGAATGEEGGGVSSTTGSEGVALGSAEGDEGGEGVPPPIMR